MSKVPDPTQEEGVELTQKKETGSDAHVEELRRGDYLAHVYIEKIKEITCPKDGTVNPMVEVTCMQQKQYTSVKQKIGGLGEVTYGEHLFLEQNNVEKKDAEQAKIKIRLLSRTFTKDTVLGEFNFDIAYIYHMKDHLLSHQWLALSDPSSDEYAKVTGYLKLSIAVSCTGDDAVEIKEDDDGDDDKDEIMMPPELHPSFYQIKIRIFEAQDLSPMDMGIRFVQNEKIDCYFTTNYKNTTLKTKVITQEKGGKPIRFEEEMWIPLQIPLLQKHLIIKCMDQDTGYDETAGSMSFAIQDLIDGAQNGKFIWKNVWGSPLNMKKSVYKTQMNEHPDNASNWKGRVLMQVTCEKTEEPLDKVVPITDQDVLDESKIFNRDKSYDVIAEIGQAIALPKSGKKYKIKMVIGGKELITKEPKVAKKNYHRFNERFEQQTLKLPYVNLSDFGKILILLMDEDKPVSYFIDSIMNYTDPDAKYHWISLLPDRCVGSVDSPNDAGIISFKLSIHDVTTNDKINFADYNSWKKPPSKRANTINIRAYIYQCRDLPAADSNGTSDPYVKVWDSSETQKQTRILQDNTNPLYFQTLELEYEVRDMDDPHCYPPFILDVWDEDAGKFESDDYLARAFIEPEDCVEKGCLAFQKDFQNQKLNEIPTKPAWFPLRYALGEPAQGEILVSFAVAEIDYNFAQPAADVDLSSRVQFETYEFNMNILGLRALQSPGILPVKKAYVQFKIKSLVPPNLSSIQDIATLPSAPGPNPTLRIPLNFQIPLPVDPHYTPNLTAIVYDNIFAGFSQPMIGVFTVPIGELMTKLQKERREQMADMQYVITELDKIMANPEFHPKSYSVIEPRSQSSSEIGSVLQSTQEEDSDDEEDALMGKTGINNSKRSDTTLEKMKGKKKRRSSRPIEESKQAIKKTVKKSVKGTLLDKNGAKKLGANEDDSSFIAFEQKEDQMQESRRKQEQLIDDNMSRASSMVGPDLTAVTTGVIKKKEDKLANLEEAEEEYLKQQELEDRHQEDLRMKAIRAMNEGGEQVLDVIKRPTYELDDRLKVYKEFDPPHDELYMGLGWDEDKDTKRKHYRQFFNGPLEENREIFPEKSPFDTFEIKRGQSRGIKKGGLFSAFKVTHQDESGQLSTECVAGYFKGTIDIEQKKQKVEFLSKRKAIVKDLIHKIKTIAMTTLGEEVCPEMMKEKLAQIDPDKLTTVDERRAFKALMGEINLGHLKIQRKIASLNQDEILKRQLLATAKTVIRLYMIEGVNLMSRDNGSHSDPYLYIRCNDDIKNERNNYQLDNSNPKFLKMFEFEASFPGCSPLMIDAYDYDDIFGDDLIGSTTIDLEDRYFTRQWQLLPEKPIECRKIYHQSSSRDQGVLKLWTEIITTDQLQNHQVWDISQRPAEEFEIRVCVFNAKDMKTMDWEGTSDVYFRAFFDPNEDVQETETHYRNQDGKPDFQYRLKYRLKVPYKNYKFSVQAFDRDFFKSNEMIGEANINLKDLIEDCQYVKKSIGLNKKYYMDVLKNKGFQALDFDPKDPNKFWLKMRGKNPETNQIEINGRVCVRIDVLPVAQADINPVGKARNQPNHSPTLPEPEGRFELSYNPIKMFNQMIGPEVRMKIYTILCIAICAILAASVAPNVIGAVIASWVSGH